MPFLTEKELSNLSSEELLKYIISETGYSKGVSVIVNKLKEKS